MIKLTVYGLPLNPMPLLEQLKGKSFCVSYFTRDKLGKQLDQAIRLVGDDQLLLVDNGAFSSWKAGVDTMNDEAYLEGFAEWANDILDRCPQAVAVLPDVIDGTHEQNAQLVCETMTMFDSERVMPIWHMHEPISYLLHLCEGFGYVGIGSSGAYANPSSPAWHARITEMFAAIDAWEANSNGAFIRPRLHMMRAQAQAHLFPFDSADSTNVAMNHGRYRHEGEGHVARFAARVDAKIQASAGPEAEHQEKRPLLGHIEMTNMRTIWLLEQAGYVVREPLELPELTTRQDVGTTEAPAEGDDDVTPGSFKSALKRLGLTHAAAAAKLDITTRTIERYASGDSEVPQVVVFALRYLEQTTREAA